MAQDVFHPDAWTRAKNRFMEDLNIEEHVRIYQRRVSLILWVYKTYYSIEFLVTWVCECLSFSSKPPHYQKPG